MCFIWNESTYKSIISKIIWKFIPSLISVKENTFILSVLFIKSVKGLYEFTWRCDEKTFSSVLANRVMTSQIHVKLNHNFVIEKKPDSNEMRRPRIN
jgi:hypothetical protein